MGGVFASIASGPRVVSLPRVVSSLAFHFASTNALPPHVALSLICLSVAHSSTMPPLILPMCDIRRWYPSRRRILNFYKHPENVGCLFGIITKAGASPKTRTLTNLYVKQHKVTGKVRN